MHIKKAIIAFSASLALALSVASPAAAASRSGTATCPARVVGGISAYSEQRTPSNYMYLKVGTVVKDGTGHSRLQIDTNYKRAFWYAQSESLRKAAGFCNPR
ncbi:hypothetical protein [Trueperella abortisuis]|uniref:Secreted protein n=1 Tax=Trueperella abortisuis TaxID=445930 RepID=A0ABT9PKW9_9ACTO|nr:hypothetical protein [Trueperella abortisuis]MDP9833039.1 hypothetical protein [Trueperella abortisuis]